jgi:hypothetical protein
VKNEVKMPVQGNCTKCGYISSQPLCKACVLLEGLNRGLPRLDTRDTEAMRDDLTGRSSLEVTMDLFPNEQNFDLDKSRQNFYHGLKEHRKIKISNIPKFRREML